MFVHFCVSGQIPPPPGVGGDLWSGIMRQKKNGNFFKNGKDRPFNPGVIDDILSGNRSWGNYMTLDQIITGIDNGYIIAVDAGDYQKLINVAMNGGGTTKNLKDICRLAYRDNYTFSDCVNYVPIPKNTHYLLLLTFLGMTLLRKYSKKYIEIKFLFFDKFRRTP